MLHLLFKKSGNDLILVTGTSEQMTIKDWYLSTANHNIANLQIVIEGMLFYATVLFPLHSHPLETILQL